MSPSSTSPTPTHHGPEGFWWKRGFVVLVLLGFGGLIFAINPGASASRSLEGAAAYVVARGELLVTVTEQGTLESSNNTEIKCRVRGDNTIISVVESGTEVEPGGELVRLETLAIEEEISERTKFAHLARATVARAKADMTRAEIAIKEYLEGQYVSTLATLQKDLAIAESNLLSSKNMLGYAKMMSDSGYDSELAVEEKEFAVAQASLNVKLTKTQIEVLNRFTKEEQLARLQGDLNAAKARYEAEKERAYADEQRLLRAEEELGYCVVKAERGGLVIYPQGREWEQAPQIEEGATVHKDQVLLLMPDLTKMQVKVGVHESIVERVTPGLIANVTLPTKMLQAEVSTVASVAKPAGWWTGNVVKYDTIVELPSVEGLKPGMSVAVEIIIAQHDDVLMVPTSAVIETSKGRACWVKTPSGVERRSLDLGDNSDMFILVNAGLEEGDEVILDPLAFIEEAQLEAAASIREENERKEAQRREPTAVEAALPSEDEPETQPHSGN